LTLSRGPRSAGDLGGARLGARGGLRNAAIRQPIPGPARARRTGTPPAKPSPVHARQLAVAAILTLSAAPATAREARASFTVGARVIRSAAIAVDAALDPSLGAGTVRVAARVVRGASAPAGVAVATAGEEGSVAVLASPLSADVALAAGSTTSWVMVTVLPDGHPPTIRFVR